jgi:hypothetical protein
VGNLKFTFPKNRKGHQTLKGPAIYCFSVAMKLIWINNEGKVKLILCLIYYLNTKISAN